MVLQLESGHRWQGNYTDCSELFKMTKTDDGFCCAFNTISVQSSYASESGEEYDPSEYEDDNYDYYDYDDEDYDDEDYDDEDYDGSETTTSTESTESTEAVTYAGSMNDSVLESFVKEQTFRWHNNNRGKHRIKFI